MKNFLRQWWLISKRELLQLVLTPIFWVISGVFFFATSLVFLGLVIGFSDPELRAEQNINSDVTLSVVRQLFWIIHYFLMIQIPLLTMRSFAEERKLKTYQLLQTLPITEWAHVLGKFTGSFVAMTLYLALTLIFPFLVEWLSSPQWPVIIGSYAVLMLSLACYLAVGLFFSSMTESQVVSAVLSYVFLFGMLIFSSLSQAFNVEALVVLSKHLTFLSHVDPFLEGLVRSRDVGYFLLATVLFLFFTVRQLESFRWRSV
ncbi:MAG: ABC transporter permease [Sumerlaeia bacterium]